MYFLNVYIKFHSVQCQRGERWVGGEFISAERIVVYSDDGKAYLYKLPTNCIVESKEFQNRSKTQSGGGRMVIHSGLKNVNIVQLIIRNCCISARGAIKWHPLRMCA